MARKSRDDPSQGFLFGATFLRDHAGQIMTDPRIAIVELIANAYDAGATEVRITWPLGQGTRLAVEDNGTGMTRAEFERRWRTFCYDRTKEQGLFAEFPPEVKHAQRTAFGRSGKGRLAGFCFNDFYQLESRKGGVGFKAEVRQAENADAPFTCQVREERELKGHGTTVSTEAIRGILQVGRVAEIVGSKFLVDPSFRIILNGEPVELVGLPNVTTDEIEVDGVGKVTVRRLDSNMQDRVVHLRGITWWVNSRMVGEPSWEGLDGEGHYLDGRTTEARRFSFVVTADVLRLHVKPDWSDFYSGGEVNAVREAVHGFVIRTLRDLLASDRREQKKVALRRNREVLGELTNVSRRMVGQFVDEVIETCPGISERDLARTVTVLGKLEQSRSGYDLLTRLAACSPDDLDTWNHLMQEFSASNAEIILTELQRRLDLIARLQDLVGTKKTDELHDLQPLFERGLWIFGPEYEAVDFRSNRSLATAVQEVLGGTDQALPNQRPDFVALPGRSIGFYGAFDYGDSGEVSGLRKVLIVELKKGGFNLTQKEVDQARDYAKELRKGNHVSKSTEMIAYVLGATMDAGLEETKIGQKDETKIVPMLYETLLARAHARTFNLQRKLKESAPQVASDAEVEEVLAQADLPFAAEATSQDGGQ